MRPPLEGEEVLWQSFCVKSFSVSLTQLSRSKKDGTKVRRMSGKLDTWVERVRLWDTGSRCVCSILGCLGLSTCSLSLAIDNIRRRQLWDVHLYAFIVPDYAVLYAYNALDVRFSQLRFVMACSFCVLLSHLCIQYRSWRFSLQSKVNKFCQKARHIYGVCCCRSEQWVGKSPEGSCLDLIFVISLEAEICLEYHPSG
jgi:hypothetical protein